MSSNSSEISQNGFSWLRRLLLIIGLPVWVFLAFNISELIVEGIASLLLHIGVQLSSVNQAVLSTIVAALLYLLSLAMVFGIPRILRRQWISRRDLGLDRLPRQMDIWLVLAGFVVYLLVSGLLTYGLNWLMPAINNSGTQNTGFSQLSTYYQYVLAFLTLVIIAPFAEELLFRGYLLGQLRKVAPAWLSILITSALFGFLHMTFSQGHYTGWDLAIDTFSLSLVLCTLRIVTRGLWAPIMVHMIKNGVAFYILFIIPLLSVTVGR